jgi:gamma-glutamylcyclotransferase (GGCT)/AIG2-like uncharacterized protein YtfP
MTDYLFAYGTLQPGLVPASMSDVAAKLIPIGKGFVRGVFYDLGSYPGAVADPNSNSKIAGTVMELPDDEGLAHDILGQLDAYEGFDPRSPDSSEYIREKQTVEVAEGRLLECWFYRYNLPVSPSQIIENGVWHSGHQRDNG